MNEEHKKNHLLNISIAILGLIVSVTAYLFWVDISAMSSAYADLNQIESISSSTQRQISLAETGKHGEKDIFVIDEATENALSLAGKSPLSMMSDPSIALYANEVLEQWYAIKDILSVNWDLPDGAETQPLNLIDMRLARDSHFKAMTDLSNEINQNAESLSVNVQKYQIIFITCLFIIGLIVLYQSLQTRVELNITKSLAKEAQIDTATGLYTRSRCQELFKSNEILSQNRQPAIIVIDLNDLKKTNDTLGHRVGDELIGTFASILKQACVVHVTAPFIGRYGGDEFIVYYDNVTSEDELLQFIKEIDFLTTQTNDNESRFQVSYAIGYAYVGEEGNNQSTARQLFDKADESMYENKKAMKRARTQEPNDSKV